MHSCSASSGKPDSNSLDCIVFSCLEVYRDWNRWNDEGFTFLGSDVSIFWVYLLSQMLFWQLMYLHCLDIHCCRCFFWDWCIRNLLFFKLADAFQPIHHVNFICILPYLGFKDTSFANFASASHVFDNVRMLLIEILHPQLALSITGRYSPPKLYIFNSPKSIISDIFPNILSCYLLLNLSQYITYKKIDIRNSSEYEMGAGDT